MDELIVKAESVPEMDFFQALDLGKKLEATLKKRGFRTRV